MKTKLIKLFIWLVVFTTLGFLAGYKTAPREVVYELISPIADNPTKCEEVVNVKQEEVKPTSSPSPKPVDTYGKASYYNRSICELHNTTYGDNCLTANGDVFSDTEFTAACPADLLNQTITVRHKDKSIQVLCNDTGSFGEKYSRVLDLSETAFEALAPTSQGVIKIAYRVK